MAARMSGGVDQAGIIGGRCARFMARCRGGWAEVMSVVCWMESAVLGA